MHARSPKAISSKLGSFKGLFAWKVARIHKVSNLMHWGPKGVQIRNYILVIGSDRSLDSIFTLNGHMLESEEI